ncbi:MAG TPA: hypothetical protein VGK23_00890 [Methanomassiliicoccales archaeon]|jgi:hypothetical protein
MITVLEFNGRSTMEIQEYTKEQVVLIYFLTHGNGWVNADTIVGWVNNEESRSSIGVLNDKNRMPLTISRAGAVLILNRLLRNAIESMNSTGYRNKKIIIYRLAENWTGYEAIVQRMKNIPTIFLESEYGRVGVEKYLMDHVAKRDNVGFGEMRDKIVWAFQHSPTALLLGVEGNIVDPDDAGEMNPEQRLGSCMVALACAIRVDVTSKNRKGLLHRGDPMDYFKSLLVLPD